jgi:hypothetical protein
MTLPLKNVLLGLASAALLANPASAQTQSSTPVIGYYKQLIKPGNTSLVAGFTTKKDFQGAMTSSSVTSPTSTINQTGATWGTNQFQTSAVPATESSHFVEILSGTLQGAIFDIVSNTATSIVVEGDLSTVGANATYCVRKHVTLGKLLENGGGLTGGSDTVLIFNSDNTSDEFTYNGSNWENVASLDDGTAKIIYPGQGFIVYRGGNTDATITIGGNDVSYVKDGQTKVPVYAGPANNRTRNFVGSINPLVSVSGTPDSTQLGNFGLVSALNAGSDTVDVFSTTGSFATLATFSSNGGNLEDVGSLDDGTTFPVPNGTALRIIVTGSTTITLPQSHP